MTHVAVAVEEEGRLQLVLFRLGHGQVLQAGLVDRQVETLGQPHAFVNSNQPPVYIYQV